MHLKEERMQDIIKFVLDSIASNSVWEASKLSVGMILGTLMDIRDNSDNEEIKNLSIEELEKIANEIKECFSSITTTNQDRNAIENCYTTVIKNSLNRIKNSNVEINTPSINMDGSLNDIENSSVKITNK